MSNQATPAGTDQPVTIRVGCRTVAVDGSPLEAATANFRTATLVEPAAGRLDLRPSWGLRLFGLAFALLGLIPFGILYGVGFDDSLALCLLTGIGVLFVAVGLLLLLFGFRARFDLNNGEVTYGYPGFRRTRPLADILAVQLIFGGWHSSTDELSYQTYQLNLVLDDPAQPRACLTNHANLSWTRWAAARLADFLDVPLLDQLPPGK
jgi:hypothetical protein